MSSSDKKKSGHIPRTVGRLPQEGRRGPCNGKGEVWFHFSLDSLVWLFQGRSESRRQLCLKELVEEGDRDHNHVLSFAGDFVFLGNILPRLNGNWIRCSVSDMTVKIQDEIQTWSWFMFIQNSGIYWSRAISRVRKVVYSDLRGGKMGQRPGSVAMHGEIFMMVWWWPWWWDGEMAIKPPGGKIMSSIWLLSHTWNLKIEIWGFIEYDMSSVTFLFKQNCLDRCSPFRIVLSLYFPVFLTYSVPGKSFWLWCDGWSFHIPLLNRQTMYDLRLRKLRSQVLVF